MHQATDRRNRYAQVTHKALSVGDLVSIKEEYHKPINYPLAVVIDVEENDLGEVTTAKVRKANGEVVRRHIDHLIFLSETSMRINEKAQKVEAAAKNQVSKSRSPF